ncbi:MAG: hypothetical protein ACLR5G_05940 [Eubacteriales bacterium]
MKKFISLMLLAALLLSAASCGSSDGGNKTTDSVQNDETTSDETSEEASGEVLPDIPERGDYGGYEFRVLYEVTGWGTYTEEHLDFDSETGDVLSDAIYRRNRLCEDKYNFKLVNIDKKDVTTALYTTILSGDDEYDLAMVTYGWAKGTDALVDFNTVPHIGLDKPWWNSSASEQMQVDGMLTNTLSDFMITHRAAPSRCSLIRSSRKITSSKIYTKLSEMANGRSINFLNVPKTLRDLDGDGKMTDIDMYGYSALDSNSFTYLIYGAGEKLVTSDDDGKPKLDINNERFIAKYQKVVEVVQSDNKWYCPKYNKNSGTDGDQSIFRVFHENRALFLSHGIGSAKKFRDMDNDFGVLPAPKYDEAQENYQNVIDAGKFMVIPKTAQDLDRTGVILESLSYEGYKSVISAYYDTMLKNKLMRDEDSIEMLDKYIFPNTVVKNFFYADVQSTIQDIVKKPESMASTIASREESLQKKIDKIYDTFVNE